MSARVAFESRETTRYLNECAKIKDRKMKDQISKGEKWRSKKDECKCQRGYSSIFHFLKWFSVSRFCIFCRLKICDYRFSIFWSSISSQPTGRPNETANDERLLRNIATVWVCETVHSLPWERMLTSESIINRRMPKSRTTSTTDVTWSLIERNQSSGCRN